MLKLKFYGLGGQGVVTAAKTLSKAVSIFEDKYAITVPAYGHERRGAPVNTSLVIDSEPILVNSFVYDPDIVLVMDELIIEKNVNIAEGIHKNSVLVLNTDNTDVLEKYKKYRFKEIFYVDATRIALNHIGRPIPNNAMLGALAATGVVKINSIEKAIIEYFGNKMGEKNAKAARESYEKINKLS
jgi:2-oxoacid:acceptor oxidoreductase gamma subunit (pyruvate/2-ketoisovalerate family)